VKLDEALNRTSLNAELQTECQDCSKRTCFAEPAAGNSDLGGQTQHEKLGKELHVDNSSQKIIIEEWVLKSLSG